VSTAEETQMLSQNEFDNWCHRLNLSEQARKTIEVIRSSQPSRRVGGGRRNVAGRYPSRKMAVTIQFESHRVELPTIYELEHDKDVLEFYDQPPPIKLEYQANNGRKLGVLSTPDFFVIRTNSAGWEECKTEENLKKLAEKSPNRYCRDESGYWQTPPGEKYSEPFGFYFRLRSDSEINWVLQRNLIFLEDYFRATSLTVPETTALAILSLVSTQPGITLAHLVHEVQEANADDIYALIVTEQLYVNLNAALLVEPERVQVFLDQQIALAYGLMVETSLSTATITSPVINLVTGTSVCWDGKGLSILHVGETELVLSGENEQLIQLKRLAFENLIKQGKITSLQTQEKPSISSQSWERFYKASPEDQEEALRRYNAIEPYLQGKTPRHGDRPFEIGHIDHTELDIELVCSRTSRNLGRPWATFLTDAYSRRLLATYLTFDPPSYRSCLMVLRLCVKHHGRFPQIVVVDNGSEFHSIYFETLLAIFECTKKHRPAAKGRFGSVCERLFGTSNTQFIHNLQGNTQIMRQSRQITKSVNPKNHAIWTLSLLYEHLCDWAYEIYDKDEHPALGQSPREAFAAGMVQSGSRLHRMISYDENFKMLTLPTTSDEKSKVQPGQGVKINYIYYWADAFRNPQIENTRVQVRYDPFDAGTAYAFVGGQWVKCISQYYADFHGRSEKELKLASSELRKRQQNYTKQSKISAKNLATFLASVEAQEALLEQRSRDAEAADVFRVIEGGRASLSSNAQSTVEAISLDNSRNFRTSEPQLVSNEAIALNELEIYEEF
jgi:transposase InsO family protein